MTEEHFYYSDYVIHRVGSQTNFFAGDDPHHEQYYEVDKSSLTLRKQPRFAKDFDSITNCPYCKAHLMLAKREIPSQAPQAWGARGTFYGSYLGAKCQNCNWWYIKRKGTIDDDERDAIDDELTTFEGIICRFEEEFWIDAIKSVENELVEYRKDLKRLDPRKVEVLVGMMLAQYHQCEVRHVGRSHDKGIDLIIVKGDMDIAVQVKHRYRSDKVEGVKPVREFVGAMVGEGYKKGLFVSTAIRFSTFAEKYSTQVTRNWAPLNLIDIRTIREIIGNISQNQWSAYDGIWGE